jgi:hypothetical protein
VKKDQMEVCPLSRGVLLQLLSVSFTTVHFLTAD